MTMPRSNLVSLSDTPWYHVVSRCVRRAYLCGEDYSSGKNFEHRRGWIESRICELSSIFAIDVAAYAVMSNHYHIVVRIDAERAAGWGDEEVLARWTRIFSGPGLVQKYLGTERDTLSATELSNIAALAETYRKRLHDLSWFMRVLNETIARMANAEDGVTGRFWEGRFKSQALLDDQALLTAMAYVDLNPVRAGLAQTPEESAHTSVRRRIADLFPKTAEEEASPAEKRTPPAAQVRKAAADLRRRQEHVRPESELRQLEPAPLLDFSPSVQVDGAIPFTLPDYLELVDALGRAVHPAKRGFIPETTPAILSRLNIDFDTFFATADQFLSGFGSAVGTAQHLTALAEQRQCRYLRGVGQARSVFGRVA
ncbi:transposase [Geoalkalibacter subterraneus]|uniref:Transposase n=1 Tax=Geoalkalibacter subterraneus TaxID=483547 RepID=A0A0B5FHG9_9BACT|nr:transposase [Geoalkalibacter subterraneus]AJF07632.1 transposase [Geoalkalibacter subterraneus]AJF07637.1 transposase [Geoalkalibacter subterraneus]